MTSGAITVPAQQALRTSVRKIYQDREQPLNPFEDWGYDKNKYIEQVGLQSGGNSSMNALDVLKKVHAASGIGAGAGATALASPGTQPPAAMPAPAPKIDPFAAMAPKPTMQTPAPAPSPQPAPSMAGSATINPFALPSSQPRNVMAQAALDGFQSGFRPKDFEARQAREAAGAKDALTKQITTLESVRALPLERRLALLPQLSQHIGQTVPESMMSNEEIDAQLALMRGDAGISPDKPEAMTPYQAEQIRIEEEKLKAAAIPKPGEAYTLGKDQTRFGPDNKPVARGVREAPPDPNAPMDPERIRLEREFAKDWKSIDSNYRDIDGQFKRMESLASLAKSDPKKAAAADLGILVSFTKMLDPGSVAREGEVKLTQSAASLADQIAYWLPRLEKGNTLLPDDLRDAYIQAAREMHGIYTNSYHTLAKDYRSSAEAYQYAPERVMMGYRTPGAEPSDEGGAVDLDAAFAQAPKLIQEWLGGIGRRVEAARTAPVGASREPVRITNDDEFDALPDGTDFIAPDGTVRTK